MLLTHYPVVFTFAVMVTFSGGLFLPASVVQESLFLVWFHIFLQIVPPGSAQGRGAARSRGPLSSCDSKDRSGADSCEEYGSTSCMQKAPGEEILAGPSLGEKTAAKSFESCDLPRMRQVAIRRIKEQLTRRLKLHVLRSRGPAARPPGFKTRYKATRITGGAINMFKIYHEEGNLPVLKATILEETIKAESHARHLPDAQKKSFFTLSPALRTSRESHTEKPNALLLTIMDSKRPSTSASEDADDTEEVLTRNILRGLPTKDALILENPEAETEHFPETQTFPHQDPPLKEASFPAQTPTFAPPPVDPVDKTPPQDREAERSPEHRKSPVTSPIHASPQNREIERPPEHQETPITPPDLTRGIRVSSLVSLQMPVHKSPALPLIPRSPHTSIVMRSSTAPVENPAPTTSDIPEPAVSTPLPEFPEGDRSEWFTQQLAEAEATGGVVMKPPEITAPPSMGAEITKSIRELYKSFTQAKEAQGRGEETHQKIGASLGKLDEWDAQLATLGNAARGNQLPGRGLMGIEDITACESLLARDRCSLEDGSVPLEILNRQLELTTQNVKVLLDSAGLPLMKGSGDSAPTESELNASLEEFSRLFSRQLSSVEERGNQVVLDFVVQAARKVERAQCLKDTLDPILVEHARVTSRALARLREPIVNTTRIEFDYAKHMASRGEDKDPIP
eukprot:Gb_37619 [translate_table: standard]